MKIYYGKNKLKAKRISLIDLIHQTMPLVSEKGSFGDESGSWLEIQQRSIKPSIVTVSISFDYEGENIDGVSVYEADIVTIIDEENQKKII